MCYYSFSFFCRAGNSLICSSLICSSAHLLIFLKPNEQLWAIHSDCSRQMSDRERIAQVAQDKWANMSDLLRLPRGNERMSDSLKKIWLNKSKILFFNFLVCFKYDFIFKNERIAHFLFFGDQCKWIFQVTHQKWAMWGIRSGCSEEMSDRERMA